MNWSLLNTVQVHHLSQHWQGHVSLAEETRLNLDLNWLAGLSRKSMIYKTLEASSSEALNGTTALNMVALQKGATILRVHDVKEAVECVTLFNQLK